MGIFEPAKVIIIIIITTITITIIATLTAPGVWKSQKPRL
jgi:hypothetical protein